MLTRQPRSGSAADTSDAASPATPVDATSTVNQCVTGQPATRDRAHDRSGVDAPAGTSRRSSAAPDAPRTSRRTRRTRTRGPQPLASRSPPRPGRGLGTPPAGRLDTAPPAPAVPAALQPRVLAERLKRQQATALRAALVRPRSQPRRLPPNLLLSFLLSRRFIALGVFLAESCGGVRVSSIGVSDLPPDLDPVGLDVLRARVSVSRGTGIKHSRQRSSP